MKQQYPFVGGSVRDVMDAVASTGHHVVDGTASSGTRCGGWHGEHPVHAVLDDAASTGTLVAATAGQHNKVAASPAVRYRTEVPCSDTGTPAPSPSTAATLISPHHLSNSQKYCRLPFLRATGRAHGWSGEGGQGRGHARGSAGRGGSHLGERGGA